MFITGLFTIAKTWRQPKCLLTGELTEKIWYIHTVKHYSALNKENPTIGDNMDEPEGHYA